MLDLPEVARRLLATRRRRNGRGGGPLHELQPGVVLLASPRRGSHRAPGGAGLDRCLSRSRGIDAGGRTRQPRARSRALRPGRRDPRRDQVRRRSRRWRRSPRPGSSWSARIASRTWRPSTSADGERLHLGLHRQPSEPQGAPDPAARAADPLGRAPTRCSSSSGSTAGPTPRCWSRSTSAGEEGKGGVEPDGLGEFIERCPVRVGGLMTMPPFTQDPETLSRLYFARLAELGAEHGLERLSMGTSQDWEVAVDEGATTIRLGSSLTASSGAFLLHNPGKGIPGQDAKPAAVWHFETHGTARSSISASPRTPITRSTTSTSPTRCPTERSMRPARRRARRP